MVSISELMSPAGDPGPWRSAATAWRTLATELQSIGSDLDGPVGNLTEPAWSGDARDAFTGYWKGKLGPEFHSKQVANYNGVADQLDKTAEKIEEYNQLAHALEIAVAAGVVISIASAGLGTLFGAGEAAAAAAEAGVAYSALEFFMGLLAQALIRYMTFWAVTFAGNVAANAVAMKVVSGKDPLDPANWSARGFAEAANASTLVGGIGALGVVGPVSAFAKAHPFAWNLGTGAFAGGAPAAYNLLELEHAKLFGDPRGMQYDAWWKIALFTGVSGGFNAGVGKFFGPKAPPKIEPYNPDEWTTTPSGLLVPKNMLKPPNVFGRQPSLIQSAELGFIPSTGLRAVVPLPDGRQQTTDRQPPTIGDVLAPPAAVQAPRTVGGGSYTVQSGDSMWTIAGERLGDPNLWPKIAAANPQVENPSVINPGQVINIPYVLAPKVSH